MQLVNVGGPTSVTVGKCRGPFAVDSFICLRFICFVPKIFAHSLSRDVIAKENKNKQFWTPRTYSNMTYCRYLAMFAFRSVASVWTRWHWPWQWLKNALSSEPFVSQSSPNVEDCMGPFLVHKFFRSSIIHFFPMIFAIICCPKTNRK